MAIQAIIPLVTALIEAGFDIAGSMEAGALQDAALKYQQEQDRLNRIENAQARKQAQDNFNKNFQLALKQEARAQKVTEDNLLNSVLSRTIAKENQEMAKETQALNVEQAEEGLLSSKLSRQFAKEKQEMEKETHALNVKQAEQSMEQASRNQFNTQRMLNLQFIDQLNTAKTQRKLKGLRTISAKPVTAPKSLYGGANG